MGSGKMLEGSRAQIARDDFDAGVEALFGLDEIGRKNTAHGMGAENAGIDMEEFHDEGVKVG
jgi:hypothetical protein